MKDNTLGRIDHTGHKHPDTSWWRKKCREEMIAAAKARPKKEAPSEGIYPEVAEREVAPPPVIRRGRHSAKKTTPPAKMAPPPVVPPSTISLDVLRDITQTLDSVEQALIEVGSLEGAAISLLVGEVPVLATYGGSGWHLSLSVG